MAVKKILIYPDPFLRKTTAIVDCEPLFSSKTGEKIRDAVIDDLQLDQHLTDMEDTLEQSDRSGAALAANQIGIGLRMFVTNQSIKDNPVYPYVINPVILKKSQETKMLDEGCLSFPGFGMQVRRHDWVEVSYVSIIKMNGERKKEQINETYYGFWAQVFQHEIEHLEGKLFVDKLPLRRRLEIAEMVRKKKAGRL